MSHIHWYPGHIAKAQKQLKEKLNLVDVIIEVIDARIPYSSWYKTTDKLCPNKPRLILMNKKYAYESNFKYRGSIMDDAMDDKLFFLSGTTDRSGH